MIFGSSTGYLGMSFWAQTDPSPTLHAVGLAGFGASLGGVLSGLPIAITCFAGIMGGISYCLVVYRDPGIQQWVTKRRLRREAKKLAKLKVRRELLEGQLLALDRIMKAKEEAKTIVAASKVEAATIARTEADKLNKH